MKKLVLIGVAALAVMIPASVASATAVTVTDPTAGTTNTFSGPYTTSTGGTGTQTGYVQVNSNGAVACNGNPKTLSGGPVGTGQGYVWVGEANSPSGSGFILQGNRTIGAGSYGAPHDGAPGQPCPQSNPTTGVTP